MIGILRTANVQLPLAVLLLCIGVLFVPAALAQPGCAPGARQIAVFDLPDYGGACSVLDAGNYVEPSATGLTNDTISSLRVGPGAAAILCWHNWFHGTCEGFYSNDPDLADNRVMSNHTSSLRVLAGDTNCTPGSGEVALFGGGQYGGYCTKLGRGYYFDPNEMQILNDSLSSLKVGPGASVSLFRDDMHRGTAELFTADDPELTDNVIGNDTVSSAVVFAGDIACNPGHNQVAVYSNRNHDGLCSLLDFGAYRDPVQIGLPGDNISSIRIGGNAAAYLCEHRDFDGTCEGFSSDDPDLSDNNLGEDSTSSLYVGKRSALGYIGKWLELNLLNPQHFPPYNTPGPTYIGKSEIHRVPTLVGRRQDIVAVLWDPVRPLEPRPEASDVYDRLVGVENSAADYLRENSGGLASLNLVDVVGWLSPPTARQGSFYWDHDPDVPGAWFPDNSDADGDSLKSGHTSRWVDGLRAMDPFFDFSGYDHDQDGTISPSELGVVMITPQRAGFGTMRRFAANQFAPCVDEPDCMAAKLRLDGVIVDEILEIMVPQNLTVGIINHELGHTLGWADMYFQNTAGHFYYSAAAQGYSIMGGNENHYDPVLKLKMGWAIPQFVMESGHHWITDVETSAKVWVLFDPAHGFDEYFIVENRWPGTSYDASLADAGLAIWHVIEDDEIYDCHTVPAGTIAADWNGVGKNWERCAISLLRENKNPSPTLGNNIADDAMALFEAGSGSIPLRWKDGTLSGFSVQPLDNAGPVVRAQITAP